MKESTGELGGTVVVIIALIVLVGIVYFMRQPLVDWVSDKFNDLTTSETKYEQEYGKLEVKDK